MANYLDFSDRHRDLENSKLRVYAKTAVHSSVVHKMLVCALRGKERKDVVFSKETVLELLEITQEGDLISIIEQPVFGTIKDLAVLRCHFSSPLLFDPVNGTAQMHLGDDISELQHLRVIPGQDVLVCLSDSGVLSFIAYTECPSANMHFNEGQHSVHKGKKKAATPVIGSCVETSRKTGKFQIIKEIPLSQPGFDYQKLGRLVCIDPSGCLIAVAAWQNIFQLFSLHRGPKVSFDQISQTKEYPQSGIICSMTFLYPSDKTRILLAMTVYDDLDKQTSIVIYQFWAEDAPERNITSFSKLLLRKDEPPPLHLIPLPNYPECFLLVNVRIIERETCFIQAKRIMNGITDFYREPLPFPEFLMTAFAYPADAFVSKHSSQQYVYAGKENGDFYRIDIISDVQIVYTLLQKGLNSIGTAMSVLCFDPNVGEFVIISGEMSDGAVVLVCPDSKTKITCDIPNWAPILDFQMLDLHQERHDVIFTCSGRDKYGSIRELRKAVGVNVITRTGPDFHGVNALWNLKYSNDDKADSFLALSYANSTRLMNVSQGELHDISEYSGLDLEVSSLCVASFGSAPGFVVQIHRLEIVVSKPNVGLEAMVENTYVTSSRWTPPENTVIDVAAVYDSIVVIGLSTVNGSIIILLRLDLDDITFSFDSSALVPYPLCVIGTFKQSIKFLSLNPDNYLEMLHEELLVDYSIMKVNIPESACFIGSIEKPFFLVGLREGTVIYYQWSWSLAENKPHLANPVVRRIGTLPVKFIVPDSSQTAFIGEQSDSNTVLALSDRPWHIEHSHHTGLNFVCVAFEHYEHVQDATVFRYADLSQGYMFISQNCLNFVQLNNFTKNNIRTIPVLDTPRRLFYDDFNKLLVVACTSCKDDSLISVLKLIDPVNGDIIHEFKMQDEDYPDNFEAVYSITGWQFTIERQEYRWICVGIGVHDAEERHMIGKIAPTGGRLMIFLIKKTPVVQGSGFKYELRKINEIDVNGAVHAICPLSETLKKVHSKELRWPILSINAYGNRICVGTQKGSLTFYDFNPEKELEPFTFLKTERLTRLISDSIMLNENLAVGADKCGNIFGLLYNKDDPSIEPCLEPVFSFHEAEIVSRLRVGYLGYRTETINKLSEASSDHNSEVKALDDLGWDINHDLTYPVATIIGCSLLGSVLLFMRISIKSYQLLSALQSVLEKWPSTRNNNVRFRSDSNKTNSINVIIDGDMVSQFLRLSRYEQLRVIEHNPELIKAGSTFIHGDKFESYEYEKQTRDTLEYPYDMEDQPMTPEHEDDDMYIEDVHDFDDTLDMIRETKFYRDNVRSVSVEEIVEALQLVLSELNMQVS
ncbi:10090_t:CDS:10 [Dentiscutata erythropus]|uniref:10090_t:CDS:1 n=1 Tax=Dentiscutata erythropus TaxID=1348616 RepID=A0A9N9BAU1_9GLOM|nr:10090_t:CDS:10 [Dentiscutata erythropus]